MPSVGAASNIRPVVSATSTDVTIRISPLVAEDHDWMTQLDLPSDSER